MLTIINWGGIECYENLLVNLFLKGHATKLLKPVNRNKCGCEAGFAEDRPILKQKFTGSNKTAEIKVALGHLSR